MFNLKPISIFLAIIFILSCQGEKEDLNNLSKANFDFSKPDYIPVSTWYSGGKARAPMLSEITENSENEWRKDLQQIKDLGFNTVRTWVEWAHCEPKEGKYSFENLTLLADLAQEIGLRFIIQLYVDSAPDWVGKKYPDGMLSKSPEHATIPVHSSFSRIFLICLARWNVSDNKLSKVKDKLNNRGFGIGSCLLGIIWEKEAGNVIGLD